jgi:hypothetical protein
MEFKLTADEALILSDLLYRISEDENIFPDIAERQVLWSIERQLDKVLVEPFKPDYTNLVNEAKDRIRYKDE